MDIAAEIVTTMLAQMQKTDHGLSAGWHDAGSFGQQARSARPGLQVRRDSAASHGWAGRRYFRARGRSGGAHGTGDLRGGDGRGDCTSGQPNAGTLECVSRMDGMATAALFGAVSASTLAAGMAMLDAEDIAYEGFIGALYPFMDVAALVTAIVLARMSAERRAAGANAGGGAATVTAGGGTGGGSLGGGFDGGIVRGILVDTLRSPAISALLVGIAIGLFTRPEAVYGSFYEPLFRGLLSILMLVMGMEAWSRLSELRKVAHAYVLYGITAPRIHGMIGFGLGLLAHHLTGFSAGGVVLLLIMAASSSDISGPPTIRGALPEANPSAYVGSLTGFGTPVAILNIPLFMALADIAIGF